MCRSSSGPSTSAPCAPNSDGVRHRFAAVNLVTGTVEHAPTGAPEHSSADRGHPPRDGCALGRRSGAVRVRVSQGSRRLWDLVVVRPHISSGLNGSGVELKDVRYRGKKVLRRAHVPILDVEYDRTVDLRGCGPTYRDWQNEEAASSPRATTSARVPCMSASGQDDIRGRHRPRQLPRCDGKPCRLDQPTRRAQGDDSVKPLESCLRKVDRFR